MVVPICHGVQGWALILREETDVFFVVGNNIVPKAEGGKYLKDKIFTTWVFSMEN